MSAQRLTMTFAGLFIMVSMWVGHMSGQVNLATVSWLWITFFVGANLTIAGLTGFCMMTKMMKVFGAK